MFAENSPATTEESVEPTQAQNTRIFVAVADLDPDHFVLRASTI